MKKLTALILLALFMFGACSTKKHNNDDEQLMKRIAKMNMHYEKVYSYDFLGGTIDESSEFLEYQKEYDKEGRVVREEIFNKSETDNFIILYEYNANNDVIAEVYYDEFNSCLGSIKNEYKSKKIVKTISYLDSGEIWYQIEYNHNGNVMEEIHLYNEEQVGRVEYVVDDSGNDVEYKQYNVDNEVESRYETQIVNNNQKIYHWFDGDDNLVRINLQIFDDAGFLIEEENLMISEDESMSFTTKNKYKYKDELLIEKMTYDINDEPISCEKTIWVKF